MIHNIVQFGHFQAHCDLDYPGASSTCKCQIRVGKSWRKIIKGALVGT